MQVVWNKRAEHHLSVIISYGIDTFGEKAAKRLEYRSLVVHKHYKLVYHIEADIIYIAALFDTRRNPASLTDHIK